MGYLHIDNLYKNQDILLFRECYALEKIHGTSAHISWRDGQLSLYSGGAKADDFRAIFDLPALAAKFEEYFGAANPVTVYGEAYGGKMQAMSKTYGPALRFVAFDVKSGSSWLEVPWACSVAEKLGIEFVHFVKVPTDIESLNRERDADSVQAIRNGMGPGKLREGVVLRPLIELQKGLSRLIVKHKRDEFRETRSPRPVAVDPEKLKVLESARNIADEWVTAQRLAHVLDKIPHDESSPLSPERTKEVIVAMLADVLREASGEIIDSPQARQAIGKKTASLFLGHLKAGLANAV